MRGERKAGFPSWRNVKTATLLAEKRKRRAVPHDRRQRLLWSLARRVASLAAQLAGALAQPAPARNPRHEPAECGMHPGLQSALGLSARRQQAENARPLRGYWRAEPRHLW